MSLDGPGGLDLATIQNNSAAPKLIRGSITFDGTAGKGATGTVTLFTTTGAVLLDGLWVRCTSDLVDAVDGALFRIGVTGTNGLFTAATYEGAFDLDIIDAGDGLSVNAAATASDGFAQPMHYDIANVSPAPYAIFDDIIMTISTQAITGGTLAFYVLYRPLSSDGALALGANMVAI